MIQWHAVDLHLHGTDIVHIKLETLFVCRLVGLLIIVVSIWYLSRGDLGNIDVGDADPRDVSEAGPSKPLLLDSIDLSSSSVLLNQGLSG